MAGLTGASMTGRIAATCLACAQIVILPACKEELDADVAVVEIGGREFFLELALDAQTRAKGLMWREHIEDDGGMLFVFPASKVRVQSFWMKNCLTDMDIIYMDGSGRVLTTHTMEAQPLKGEAGNPNESEREYERRMQRDASYSSRFPSQFVIEIQAGMVEKLGVREGDQIEFDTEGLKRRAE